jgi:hypothetical protein
MRWRAGRHPARRGAALAVLGLLSAVAGERALTRVIDDEHWADHASMQGIMAWGPAAGPLGVVAAACPVTSSPGCRKLKAKGLREYCTGRRAGRRSPQRSGREGRRGRQGSGG